MRMTSPSVFASFLTTVNARKFLYASNWLLNPLKRSNRNKWLYNKRLKTAFVSYLGLKSEIKKWVRDIATFYNARSALFHWIKQLWIWKGDEIILQAYTCVSVSNAIIATWAMPVYVDIDTATLNIDHTLIKAKITKNTKAILIQHTLGIPAEIKEIQSIAKDNDLKLIEDCAHSLGAKYRNQMVWTFWDMAIYSFWRDKIISSVNWGVLIMKGKIKPIYSLKYQDLRTVAKNLVYCIVGFKSYKTYDFLKIWKALYYLFWKGRFNLFPSIIWKGEYDCKNKDFNHKMPNCLAQLALMELENIEKYNQARMENTILYAKEFPNNIILDDRPYTKAVYLRTVALVSNQKSIMKKMKAKGIHLGTWYQQPIAPYQANSNKAYYKLWTCPRVEEIASKTINLPNHDKIKYSDLKRVITELSEVI